MLRAIRAVNKGLHYVAGALIAVLMLFTVYNILGRWLFGAPLRGTVELTQLVMIGVVYLGLAYAQHHDDHISVDLLYQRVGRRGRAVLDGLSAVLSIVILALIAWRLYQYGAVLEAGGGPPPPAGSPSTPSPTSRSSAPWRSCSRSSAP